MTKDEGGQYQSKDGLSLQDVRERVPTLDELAKVTPEEIMKKDSTNMRPADWTIIADRIHQLSDQFDAFVVVHGTDTMTYTAGALALAFGRGLTFPIILTGSQLPLIEPGSDARFNLENSFRAAEAAVRQKVAEVMISFSHTVLRGCRARKRSEVHFDAFESPACDPLATIDRIVVFDLHARKRADADRLNYRPFFAEEVLHVRLTPGMRFLDRILALRPLKGVVLESFGAGNIPSSDDDRENPYSLVPVIKELATLGIPVVTTTSFVGGRTRQDIYQTGQAALNAGAIPAFDLTTEMAHVKLMWLLGLGKDRAQIQNEMTKEIVGEVTTNRNSAG